MSTSKSTFSVASGIALRMMGSMAIPKHASRGGRPRDPDPRTVIVNLRLTEDEASLVDREVAARRARPGGTASRQLVLRELALEALAARYRTASA
jgi:hypothetical protein